ncbi:MAG: sensor histidine kinase [Candidatus Kapaibacteriales bacterium]
MNILQLSTTKKWQVKLALIIFATVIVAVVIVYSNFLVGELVKREKNSIELFADVYRRYSNPDVNPEELDFLVNRFANLINFPIIMTDENNHPIYPFESYSMNITFDSKWNLAQKREYLKKLINKMSADYEPIVIRDQKGQITAKFFYTHSSLTDNFKYFPLIEIIVAIIFIGFAYLAFSNIRNTEESKLWVGMAKEAAHQLGTPLSSLLAWIELLRIEDQKINRNDILAEMEKDIIRLKTISERFSKIGSQPEIKRVNLIDLLNQVIDYFERRAPHLGKKITILRDFPPITILADINPILFEWVIENLLKNAFESIDKKEGIVKISVVYSRKKIQILISDNGRGMNARQKRNAFLPGYTTKKRGWGIGLTFCKRIIENYHNSKIFIKESAVGKGTTFAIELTNKFPINE